MKGYVKREVTSSFFRLNGSRGAFRSARRSVDYEYMGAKDIKEKRKNEALLFSFRLYGVMGFIKAYYSLGLSRKHVTKNEKNDISQRCFARPRENAQ